MDITTILFYLAGLILIYVLGIFLVVPLRILIKLFLNAIIGIIVLFLFNIVGGIFNFSLSLNFLNAFIVGFLGVPGVILLIILKIIL